MPRRIPDAREIAMIVGVIVVVGFVVSTMVAAVEDVNIEDDWCDGDNETRVNAQVIGDHGGLHCEHSNGSSVHYPKDFSGNESTDQTNSKTAEEFTTINKELSTGNTGLTTDKTGDKL